VVSSIQCPYDISHTWLGNPTCPHTLTSLHTIRTLVLTPSLTLVLTHSLALAPNLLNHLHLSILLHLHLPYNGAKDDTTTICDGNSNEHMVSDNEDATSLENIETTGRSSWFAAFLASIDDFLKNDSTAVVAINGYQGRLSHTKDPLKDSTNGCFMISALAIVALLESGNNCCLSDDEINNIMDNTAPELLVQMRSALGMDRFSNGNISETFNFLYQQRVFSHSYFQAAVGGNILDEPTLHRLFTNIEKQNCAKVGVSLFFRGHVITIMKIDENYEIFDSLPVWDHAHSIRISMACEG